jgi:hypothetical protein
MNTKDLLKEAIADAKAVRETALAQAKLALEEAFTPRLQSMLAAKLQEEMDDELKEEAEIDEVKAEMDEANDAKEKMDEMADMESYDDDDNSIDEIDLDEILAELNDEMDADKKSEMNEAKDDDAEEMEDEESEEDTEDDEMDAEEDVEEEKEVSELSMDELEELIRDIVSQETGSDTEEASMDMTADASMELPDTADDEVNLDEILAELLGEEMDELDEVKETKSLNESTIADVLTALAGVAGMGLTGAAIIKAQDLLKQKNPELYAKLQNVRASMSKQGVGMDMEEAKEKKDEMKEELQLALKTVNTLRHELQEVNLLNAKLLYVNKIFKAKNLTESQKIKVVKAFDKAESAKEAKLVFESLSETFSAKAGRNQIKESLGFASKAAGIAPQKSTIVEGNDFIARMQKLANIK